MTISITAKRLRQLRSEKDVSQEVVAKYLGISRPAYVRYETGVSYPSRTLKQLADYFHVSMDYIAGKSDIRTTDTSTTSSTANITTDTITLTAEEQEHLAMLRALSPEARRRVERNLKGEYEDSIDSQMQETTVC